MCTLFSGYVFSRILAPALNSHHSLISQEKEFKDSRLTFEFLLLPFYSNLKPRTHQQARIVWALSTDGWKRVRTAVLESMWPQTVPRHVFHAHEVVFRHKSRRPNVRFVRQDTAPEASRRVVKCVSHVVLVRTHRQITQSNVKCVQ